MARTGQVVAFAFAWAAALVSPAQAEQAAPGEMRVSIFGKLEYDRSYFQRVLALRAEGKTDRRLTREEFEAEVKRAEVNLPVLERLFAEKDAYFRGKTLSYPEQNELHRVYTNLVGLLNLFQALERQDWKAAIEAGQHVVVRTKRNLGLVRSGDSQYYLNLYREFFHQMSVAHYRLGQDEEAVNWMARIEADADLLKLKQKIAAKPPSDVESRAERLAALREMPLAVIPMTSQRPEDKESQWLGTALPEVLGNDLVQHTDLVVVDRTNVQKVMKEVALSMSGVTEDKLQRDVGKMLAAGTLLVGTYRAGKDKVWLSLRLVDVADGRALAAAEGDLRAADVFTDARGLLLKLFGEVGFIDATVRAEMAAARAPRTETMRDLLAARLLMATKKDEAKALFAKAMKDDPAHARLFEDLKQQFSGIASTVALLPFVNTSGAGEDLWMIQGAAEALSTDLPKIGFTVVERAQLAAVFGQRHALGQVVAPESARDMGQQLGADFVVLGSLLHQKPRLRADVRFVDVRSGVVAATVSAEDGRDDFMQLLVSISTAVARRFNEKLSQQTIDQLAGKKMSRDEFERFARQELAKESLTKSLKPVEIAGAPSRKPFWIAVAGAVAGTGIASAGFLLGSSHRDQAAYSEALLKVATRPEDQQRLESERSREQSRARAWNAVGFAGAGVAVLSVGYIVYQEIAGHERKPGELRPVVNAGPMHASVALGGSF